MTPIDLGSYKSIYLQTAKEYINSMFLNCDKLSNNLSDKEAINQVHISSHSLKSQSQVMGFTDIANICLNIEEMSNDALKGTVQLNTQIISGIKKSLKELEEMLKQAKYPEGHSA